MRFNILTAIVTFSYSLLFVNAQHFDSKAHCNPPESLKTQEGYDPCMLSAALVSACNGNYTVAGLSPSSNAYENPTSYEVGHSGECLCSTITYNSFQACSTCQGGASQTWASWKSSCSQTYITEFTKDTTSLRPEITIPKWALIDTSGDQYDQADAQKVGNNGDPTSIEKKSNVKLIAGIVGGIVGLLLVFGIICLKICVTRRRKTNEKLASVQEPVIVSTPYTQLPSQQSLQSLPLSPYPNSPHQQYHPSHQPVMSSNV